MINCEKIYLYKLRNHIILTIIQTHVVHYSVGFKLSDFVKKLETFVTLSYISGI